MKKKTVIPMKVVHAAFNQANWSESKDNFNAHNELLRAHLSSSVHVKQGDNVVELVDVDTKKVISSYTNARWDEIVVTEAFQEAVDQRNQEPYKKE